MAHTPPRKPHFLSSVPAQPTIETARFGAKPAQSIRPLVPDAQTPAGVKPEPGAEAQGPLTRGQNAGSAPQPATQSAPAASPQTGTTPTGSPANTGPAPVPPALTAPQTVPLDLVRGRLAASIDALRLQSEKLAEQARADVLEVAFQIARRIVEVEVRQSPEPLFALIRTSLGQLAMARRINLRVSPQDIDSLRGARGQELTGAMSLAEVELTADAALEPGECLIDSDLGQIDGRLANRFAELRRHVAEASEGAA